MNFDEIKKRRTFAIISHPDAGKTTLTEKFLLYGGAINLAGSVKGRKTAKYAVSDWMDIEKERGISVSSSVMQFNYNDFCINILDTPGHQDFSEDTYRTLMAADSAVMVIDASKGVEAQTKKLFKVCVMRNIPIFTFINKLDREAKDPFELIDDIEEVLGIRTCPINWPIGCGKEFKGVYDRASKKIHSYSAGHAGMKEVDSHIISFDDNAAKDDIGEILYSKLLEDIELLDGASDELDMERVNKGKLSPVFFGSALTNFGVETFLSHFLDMTSPPLGRSGKDVEVDPMKDEFFSAFVFKIQANMNKAHRDRIAFMRICSGEYTPGMEVIHIQAKKKLRINQSTQMMADERKIVEKAYAGDIIGVFDPGIFAIGDTLSTKDKIEFEGIPTFAPEHFARVRQIDTMKRKQFIKGIYQIAQEGAIQIFQEFNTGMEEIIVGVVGQLQFEVLTYRLENEYNVEVKLEKLPYEHIRWIDNYSEINIDKLQGTSDMKKIKDLKDRPLLIFVNPWSIRMVEERNPDLVLSDFAKN